MKNQIFEKMIREFAFEKIEDYGIACFTTKNDNTLLWSHYADEHQGICLEFDFYEEIKLIKNNKIDIEKFNSFYLIHNFKF